MIYASAKVNYELSTHFQQSACVNLSGTKVNAQYRGNCIIDKLSILYKNSQWRFSVPLIFVHCHRLLLHCASAALNGDAQCDTHVCHEEKCHPSTLLDSINSRFA